jgi:hypothetical protein
MVVVVIVVDNSYPTIVIGLVVGLMVFRAVRSCCTIPHLVPWSDTGSKESVTTSVVPSFRTAEWTTDQMGCYHDCEQRTSNHSILSFLTRNRSRPARIARRLAKSLPCLKKEETLGVQFPSAVLAVTISSKLD